jgi:hypothetical protein
MFAKTVGIISLKVGIINYLVGINSRKVGISINLVGIHEVACLMIICVGVNLLKFVCLYRNG